MTNSKQVNNTNHLIFAAISMAVAVVLGAMAAHYLKSFLPFEKIASFQTAIRYQVIHSLAIILLVLLSKNNYFVSTWVYHLFKIGILLFSGSIIILSTSLIHGQEWVSMLGPITPIGGLCFISGWVLLAFNVVKK